MQRLSTGLIATFTALTFSFPLEAETDPCSRVYSVAATIMLARQMGTLLPEVIKNTNALVAALPEKRSRVVDSVLRNVIIDAYRQEKGLFPSSSAVEEFGNTYALKCLAGKDDSFSEIIWDEPTRKAFGMWATVMGSEMESSSDHSERQGREKALELAFKRAEAEARVLEALKKNEEAESVAAKTLDAMTTRITQVWRRPVAFRGGLEVYLRMSLASNGELVDVRIVKTSGDVLFDRSATSAVKRAAPFDEVKQFDDATFEEKFRSLTVKFRPED